MPPTQQHTSPLHRCLISVILAWLLLLSPSVTGLVFAQPPGAPIPAFRQCRARTIEVVITGKSGTFDVVAKPNRLMVVNFPFKVTVKDAKWVNSKFTVVQEGNTVKVTADENIDLTETAHVHMETEQFNATMRVSLTPDSNQATTAVDVVNKPVAQICREANQRDLEQRAKLERDRERRRQRDKLYKGRTLYAIPETPVPNDRTGAQIVEADFVEKANGQSKHVDVYFDVYNPYPETLPLASLHVSNDQITDHVADRVALKVPIPADPRVLGVIPPNSQIRGVVTLPEAANNSVESLRLELRTANGMKPIVAAAKSWRFRPVSNEQLEREAAARQVALSLHALTGAFWFSDSTGLDDEKAAFLWGLGLHAQKGLGNGFTLEGELQAAWTGDARFGGVIVDGVAGELSRNASLGRFILSGSTGFGHPLSTTVRVGLGLQAASQNTRFVEDSMTAPNVDSFLEWSTFVAFGADLKRRLGKHVVLGIRGAVVTPFAQSDTKPFRRSLEIGLQLGFGWSLSEPDDPYSQPK